MTEPTLNSIKAENAAEQADREEALRLAKKTELLNELANIETRIEAYIAQVTKRRQALKAHKVTAHAFLDAIHKRADIEDLDNEEIETLIRSIEEYFASLGCPASKPETAEELAPLSPAQIERLRPIIEDHIRRMIRDTSLRRGV